MSVRERRMDMRVRMRFRAVPAGSVGVLVVLVVTMRVRMFDGLVPMLVGVDLGDVEPDAPSHQERSDRQ